MNLYLITKPDLTPLEIVKAWCIEDARSDWKISDDPRDSNGERFFLLTEDEGVS